MVRRMSGTEVWHWGDLFELDVPVDATVNDLGEMIELRFADAPETPLLLAVFSDEPHGPESAVAAALERFAHSRGLPRGAAQPVLGLDQRGVAVGRLAFVTDLAWEALAVAWHRHLLVAFGASPDRKDPVFAAARRLIATLRPSELIAPRALGPESPGDF